MEYITDWNSHFVVGIYRSQQLSKFQYKQFKRLIKVMYIETKIRVRIQIKSRRLLLRTIFYYAL